MSTFIDGLLGKNDKGKAVSKLAAGKAGAGATRTPKVGAKRTAKPKIA
jgi:hypothetical protein